VLNKPFYNSKRRMASNKKLPKSNSSNFFDVFLCIIELIACLFP
jgi:hypothetical protein